MGGKHVGIFDAVVLGGDIVAQIVAELVALALILLGLAGQTTGANAEVGVCATKEA